MLTVYFVSYFYLFVFRPASSTANAMKLQKSQTARHTKTLKIFATVTAMFILSFVPIGIVIAVKSPLVGRGIAYTLFIRIICNPFVYLYFNETFRNALREYASKYLCKCGQ